MRHLNLEYTLAKFSVGTFSTMDEMIKGFLSMCCPFPFSNMIPVDFKYSWDRLMARVHLAGIFELSLPALTSLFSLLAFFVTLWEHVGTPHMCSEY